jgi:hypothetical protein
MTWQKAEEIAKNCGYKSEFRTKHKKAYIFAYSLGPEYYQAITAHMTDMRGKV